MRILLTNDDGIHAEGLRILARAVRNFGEVKIVAPDRERSACGHSMTMRDPLRIKSVDYDGIEAYEVNGVPVGCVNVGLTCAWPDGCDLVLSGINHGPNMGYDVTYSGTVAGAMEGAINGIRSIAFSMALFVDGAPLHFETGERWIVDHWQILVNLPFPDRVFWNVNVPAIAEEEVNGHRFTTLGRRVYEDRVEERSDPWGRSYFWQGGVVVVDAKESGTDVEATSQGFVSLSPLTLDWTANQVLSDLRAQSGLA